MHAPADRAASPWTPQEDWLSVSASVAAASMQDNGGGGGGGAKNGDPVKLELTLLPADVFHRSNDGVEHSKSPLGVLNSGFHDLVARFGLSSPVDDISSLATAMDKRFEASPLASWRDVAIELATMIITTLHRHRETDLSEPPSLNLTTPRTANDLRVSTSRHTDSGTFHRSLRPFMPRSLRTATTASIRRAEARTVSVAFRESVNETPHPFTTSPTSMVSKADVGDEEDDGSYTINQHVVLMPLGHGSQGEVVLAMDTNKNELRAIKAVPRPKGIHSDDVARGALGAAKVARRQQLEREIAIMKHCRHRNLVALHEVIDDPDLDVMYLVMQYVDKGPIAKLRDDWTIDRAIDPVKLAGYTVQLCAGLSYLHRKGVIHRDIKPDNVLIGSRDDVYLADFGTSDIFRGDESHRVLGHRGTLPFMAPELVLLSDDEATRRRSKATGEAVDIWALGVTLYVLLYGKMPWTPSSTHADLVRDITTSPLRFPCPSVPIPEQAEDLLSPSPPNAAVAESYFRRSSHAPSDTVATAHASNDGATCPTNAPNQTVQTTAALESSKCLSSPLNGDFFVGDESVALQWISLLQAILIRDPTQRISTKAIAERAQYIVDLHNLRSGPQELSESGATVDDEADAVVFRRRRDVDDYEDDDADGLRL